MRKKGLLPLILGLLLLTVFASAAFAPEFFTSYSQKELFTKWLPMSREHLLGTNAMGYDILTELIYGARQTLLVGILSSILTLILGAGIGILGSFRGWIGQLFNGLIQIFVLLSKLVTLIVLATFFWKFRRAPDRPDCGVQLGRHGARRARKGFAVAHTAVYRKLPDSRLQPHLYCRAAHSAEPVGRAALALSARGEQLHYDGVDALVSGPWRSLSPNLGDDGQFCV